MSDGIVLTQEAFARVARAVQAYEAGRHARPAAAVREAPTYVKILYAPTGNGPYQGVLSGTRDGVTWVDRAAVVDARAINGELLSVGERYRGDCVGYSADGVPLMLVVATCCTIPGSGSGSGPFGAWYCVDDSPGSGSGSGSGSGGGGGSVQTACCPNAIPATLTVVVTNGGNCNGTYSWSYMANGTPPGWYGTMQSCGGHVYCNGTQWALQLAFGYTTSATCSPLQMVFTGVDLRTCGGTAGATVTVTP